MALTVSNVYAKKPLTFSQKVQNPELRVSQRGSPITFNFQGFNVIDSLMPRLNFVFESMIAAPVSTESVFNGIVQATGVSLISDTKMVITYNTKDNTVEGGLDVVDITNLKSPVILKSFIMPHMEFADSKIVGSKLYLTGVSEDNGAALITVDIADLSNPQIIDTKLLSSYYATSLSVLANSIYVTTGDTNGFVYNFLIDANGIPVEQFKDSYPKNLLYVKHYKNGYVFLYDENDGVTYIAYKDIINNTLSKVKVNNSHLISPARFDINGSIAYVNAADSMSIEIFNLDSMTKITSVAINGRGNGIQFDDNLLFLAQGLEGFKLLDASNLRRVKFLGRFDFIDQGAGNNIWTFNESLMPKKVVILADGLGGVKILSQEKKQSSTCSDLKVVLYQPHGKIKEEHRDRSHLEKKDKNKKSKYIALGKGGSIILELDAPAKFTKSSLKIKDDKKNKNSKAKIYTSNSLTCDKWTFVQSIDKDHSEINLEKVKEAKFVKIEDDSSESDDGYHIESVSCEKKQKD